MVEAIVLWVSLVVVVLTVAAGSALRHFRWPRLERLTKTPSRFELIEAALKKEREILDGLLILRLLGSVVLVLSLIGGGTKGLGDHPLEFLSDLGIVLLVFLLGIYGIIRGIVRAAPERTLLLLWHPTIVAASWMRPFVALTDAIGRVLARALGLEQKDESEDAREEILDAVSEGERDGAIDDDKREMIENIIEVQDQAVSEIMTPRTSVFGLQVDTPLEEAVALAVEDGHSRIPLYEKSIDDVCGVLYVKDLLAHWAARNGSAPILRDVMRTGLFIPETKKTSDLLEQFRSEKVHLAIVVDEYGGMAGLVTIEDILEEIVGEIEDEFDRESEDALEPLKLLDEGQASVAARVHIDELNEALNLELPEGENYDTVGGFLFSQMGRVPNLGEHHRFENVEFEILEVDERRIHRVKVVVDQ